MGSRRQRDIRTNRGHPHHRLPAHSVLPLFDTLFGVALTLLAYSLPERLSTSMDAAALTWAILTYLLAGVAVVVYWYKLRRLVEISRVLFVSQLIFGVAGLLLIVLMPKLAQLVVLYGGGTGDLLHWTPSQIVNTVFLACLLLFDGFCLLFAVSLLGHGHVAAPKKTTGSGGGTRSVPGVCLVAGSRISGAGIDGFQ